MDILLIGKLEAEWVFSFLCITLPINYPYNNRFSTYSVMQSDGNSISGDVVLDSFNRAFWDVYNILDQIYKSKYVRINLMIILIFYNTILKCLLTLH